jgi:hypothetical protein
LNWYFIGEAFWRPISSTDDVSDYAPAQILAEAFRQRWHDVHHLYQRID